jgi:hypothetical protein
MARKQKNVENVTQTPFDLEYLSLHREIFKNMENEKMHTSGPGVW